MRWVGTICFGKVESVEPFACTATALGLPKMDMMLVSSVGMVATAHLQLAVALAG